MRKAAGLNPWNIDGLKVIESETDTPINTIIPAGACPSIVALREQCIQLGVQLQSTMWI